MMDCDELNLEILKVKSLDKGDPTATDRVLPIPNPGCDDSELANLSRVYLPYTAVDTDIFPQSIDHRSLHHFAFGLPKRPAVN
jgi:hypothetical protein